jgi:hypothetical protein
MVEPAWLDAGIEALGLANRMNAETDVSITPPMLLKSKSGTGMGQSGRH